MRIGKTKENGDKNKMAHSQKKSRTLKPRLIIMTKKEREMFRIAQMRMVKRFDPKHIDIFVRSK